MGIAERLANLPVWCVLLISAVLFVIRMVLIKQKGQFARSAAETVESALVAIVLVFLVIRPFVVQAFFIPSESMVPTLEIGDRILVNKFIYRFREPQHGDIIVFKSPPKAADPIPAQWTTTVGKVVGTAGKNGELEVKLKPYYLQRLEEIPGFYVVNRQGYGNLLQLTSAYRQGDKAVIKLLGVDNASTASELLGAELRVSERDFIKRVIGRPGDVIEVKNGAVYRNGHRLNEPYLLEDYIDYNTPPQKVPKGMLWVMGDNRNNSKDSHVWGLLDRNRVLGKAMIRFWPISRIGLIR
jgi:signal peptidase I